MLVRSVNTGSAAEKGGLKAGDVITKFDGERIRSLGELREKLAAKSEKATLTVTRRQDGTDAEHRVACAGEGDAASRGAQHEYLKRRGVSSGELFSEAFFDAGFTTILQETTSGLRGERAEVKRSPRAFISPG